MLQRYLLICLILNSTFLIQHCFAQATQLISYQGVARDNSGNILASQNIGLRIGIRQGSPTGTISYCESHAVTTNTFGLFAVEIGGGTVILGSMNINWANGPYYVETEMDASGGTTYLSLGTQQLLSVPYSLHSATSADNQWTQTGNNLSSRNTGNVGINEPLPFTKLHVSRDVADAETPISLLENTGIIVIGPITDNIVADYRGIQARTGSYIPSLTLTTSELNLQRLGGDILIHGNNSSDAGKVIVTSSGRFGIGDTAPTAPLGVRENSTVNAGSIAAYITNSAATTSTTVTDNRVCLEIKNTGNWGGASLSKNIGIYVSEVSGQSAHEANIAAVLNGNTVIGDITANSIIGTNGTNVLAIQNGTAPSNAVSNNGTPDGGIQIFSENDLAGVSVFNVMNGNGDIIKLYREQAITLADASAISTTAYGTTEATVINNMRSRINELENILKNLGLLTP